MQPIKQFVFYSISLYALYFGGAFLWAQPKSTTLVSSFAPAIKNLNPQHKKCALLLGINDGNEYQTVLLSFDPKTQKIEQTANLPLLASPQGKQFHFIYSLLTDTLYNEQRTQTVATTKIKKQTTVTNWWHKTQTVLYLSNNRKYLADIIAQINKNRQPQANKALPDCSSYTYLEANDIQTINYIIPKYANFLHQKQVFMPMAMIILPKPSKPYAYHPHRVLILKACLIAKIKHTETLFTTILKPT